MPHIFNRNKSPLTVRTRAAIITIAVLVVATVITAMWFGFAVYNAKSKIITGTGNPGSILFHKSAGDITPADLKGDSDGRVNILLLGVGGDNHPGSYLTDTIQILSLDTQNHKAAMLSVPRDLYYKYSAASYGRINEMYTRGDTLQKGNGANYSKDTISALLGIPIHYYLLIDFQAFLEMVNALGGVTVAVDQPLDDCNYPRDVSVADLGSNLLHTNCKSLEGDYVHVHFNAGTQTMNGAQALVYARSRHSSSDFDRSRRQQQIMVAIKQKALSAGILTNPLKLTQLISILGNHVRTDMQISDIQALAGEVKDLQTNQIISQVIDSSAAGPLTGQTIGGADVLVPKDGDYTYQAVKNIAHGIFTNPYLVKEDARIEIRNASGKSGLGATVAALLKSYGYNVTKVSNNPTKETFTQLINYSGDKNPFTTSFLEKRFGVKSRDLNSDPAVTTDFVLVLGLDYDSTTKKLPISP